MEKSSAKGRGLWWRVVGVLLCGVAAAAMVGYYLYLMGCDFGKFLFSKEHFDLNWGITWGRFLFFALLVVVPVIVPWVVRIVMPLGKERHLLHVLMAVGGALSLSLPFVARVIEPEYMAIERCYYPDPLLNDNLFIIALIYVWCVVGAMEWLWWRITAPSSPMRIWLRIQMVLWAICSLLMMISLEFMFVAILALLLLLFTLFIWAIVIPFVECLKQILQR